MKRIPLLIASSGLFLATGVSSWSAVPAIQTAVPAAPPTFQAAVRPLIENHCLDCHDQTTHKAGLRLDNLPADFRTEKSAATWTHVFDKLLAGEMPPKRRSVRRSRCSPEPSNFSTCSFGRPRWIIR